MLLSKKIIAYIITISLIFSSFAPIYAEGVSENENTITVSNEEKNKSEDNSSKNTDTETEDNEESTDNSENANTENNSTSSDSAYTENNSNSSDSTSTDNANNEENTNTDSVTDDEVNIDNGENADNSFENENNEKNADNSLDTKVENTTPPAIEMLRTNQTRGGITGVTFKQEIDLVELESNPTTPSQKLLVANVKNTPCRIHCSNNEPRCRYISFENFVGDSAVIYLDNVKLRYPKANGLTNYEINNYVLDDGLIRIPDNFNLTIILNGENEVKYDDNFYNYQYFDEGISLGENSVLTIKSIDKSSNHSLEVVSRDGAGIGGQKGGTINIESGKIIAKSGGKGAGIGYSDGAWIEMDINITGGDITAEGSPYYDDTNGTIIGLCGAGIGGAATIGGGSILIENATVNAIGHSACAIGCGAFWYNANLKFPYDIKIKNSTVTAKTKSEEVAALGGGASLKNSGKILIQNSTVTASANNGNGRGAAIGGGLAGSSESVIIENSNITAKTKDGAGIGTGEENEGDTSTKVGDITIKDSYIVATGFGIGAGADANPAATDECKFEGNNFINANKIYVNGDASNWSGVILKGNEGKLYPSSANITRNVEIPSGKTLTIEQGQNLIINAETTLTNKGTIINKGIITIEKTGKLENKGTIINEGGYIIDKNKTDINTISNVNIIVTESPVYNGKPQKPNVTVEVENKQLTQGTDYTLSYHNNVNASVDAPYVRVQFINAYSKYKDQNFTIKKAEPTVSWKELNLELPKPSSGTTVSADNLTPHINIGLQNGEQYSGSYKFKYRSNGATGNYKDGLPQEVGTYSVKLTIPENINYKEATSSNELTLKIKSENNSETRFDLSESDIKFTKNTSNLIDVEHNNEKIKNLSYDTTFEIYQSDSSKINRKVSFEELGTSENETIKVILDNINIESQNAFDFNGSNVDIMLKEGTSTIHILDGGNNYTQALNIRNGSKVSIDAENINHKLSIIREYGYKGVNVLVTGENSSVDFKGGDISVKGQVGSAPSIGYGGTGEGDTNQDVKVNLSGARLKVIQDNYGNMDFIGVSEYYSNLAINVSSGTLIFQKENANIGYDTMRSYNSAGSATSYPVKITGGTIYNLKSDGDDEKTTIDSRCLPKNGNNKRVYHTVVDLKKVYGTDAKVTDANIDGVSYNFDDVYTSDNGKIHIYLPEGTSEIKAHFDGVIYKGRIGTDEEKNELKKDTDIAELNGELTLSSNSDVNVGDNITASFTNSQTNAGKFTIIWFTKKDGAVKELKRSEISAGSTTDYNVPTEAKDKELYCKVISENLSGKVEKSAGTVTNKTKAEFTAQPSAVSGLIYDNSAKILVNEGSTNDGEIYYAVNTTQSKPDDIAYSKNIPQEKNAGTYYVYYKIKGDSEHKDNVADNPIIVKIAKASLGYITPPNAVADLEYNGEVRELISANSSGKYTLYYKVCSTRPSGTSGFKSDIPKAKNAGTYKVYYYAKAKNGNYKDSKISLIPIRVSIEPKDISNTISVTNASTTLTYNGEIQKPNSIVVKESEDATDNLTINKDYKIIANDKNAGNCTYTIRKIDNANYKFNDKIMDYTIDKANISVAVVNTSITYGADIPQFSVNITDDVVDSEKQELKTHTKFGTTAAKYSDVSSTAYDITAEADTHNIWNNYNPSFTNGKLSITKANISGKQATISAVKKSAKNYTYDLSNLLPSIPSDASFGNITYELGNITNDNGVIKVESSKPCVSITDNTLSVDVNSVENKDKTAVINITINSENYTITNAKLIVKTTDKPAPIVTITPYSKFYDGEKISIDTIKNNVSATYDGQKVNGNLVLAQNDGLDNVIDVESTAYTVAVKFVPDSTDYMEVDTTIDITINKATPKGTPKYSAISSSGHTLEDAKLSADNISPANGSITWDKDKSTEVTKDTSYAWTYTPNAQDTKNYNNLTGSIVLWKDSGGGSSGGNGGGSGSGGNGGNSSSGGSSGGSNGGNSGGTGSGGSSSTIIDEKDKDKDKDKDDDKDKTKDEKDKDKDKDKDDDKDKTKDEKDSINTDDKDNKTNINFADVKKSDWFYKAVMFVSKRKIMLGTDKNTFSPELNTTRAMIVTILYRLSKDEEVNYKSLFEDVKKDKWYYKGVAWARANKIVKGVSHTKFEPNADLTREQLVAIVFRYAKYKKYDTSKKADLSKYSDLNDVSDYAKEAMQWAVANGIINGTSDTTLSANTGATRAEMAAIIMRFIQKFEQEDKKDIK